MIAVVICLMWFMGALSIVLACVVAYVGDRNRAHQGTVEGLGLWIVAALLQIAERT